MLVDRLWPRGLTKEEAAVKFWLRDLAPSTELRQWFHANPDAWTQFRKRYLKELTSEKATAAVEKLYDLAESEEKVNAALRLAHGRTQQRNRAERIIRRWKEATVQRRHEAQSQPEE